MLIVPLRALALLVVMTSGCDYVFRIDGVEPVDAADPMASVARWDFDATEGLLVADSIAPGLDLSIAPASAAMWQAGALSVEDPVHIQSANPALKVIDAFKDSTALTIEAWVQPQSVTLAGNGPGRVFTISAGPFNDTNVMLGQTGNREWVLRLRTSQTDEGGEPQLVTAPLITTPPALAHVVAVHDGTYRIVYVDGVEQARDGLGGDLGVWDETYLAALANEIGTGDLARPWLGVFHRIELFAYALDQAAIQDRFAAGPD